MSFAEPSVRVFDSDIVPAKLLPILRGLEPLERLWLVRLWVTEGAPYAFRGAPLLYESLREFLGLQLGICPKAIFVIGSSRLGFSMAPNKFGRPFRDGESDLDLTFVDERLFHVLARDFESWLASYDAGRERPTSEVQERYWRENAGVGSSQLRRGFISHHLVPGKRAYESFRLLNRSLDVAHRRLGQINGASAFKKVTGRVYRDWESYFAQAKINLEAILDSA